MKKFKLIAMLMIFVLMMTACTSKNTAKDANETQSTATPEPTAAQEQPTPTATETQATPTPESTQPAEKMNIRVAALKGPTAIGMVKLMDDAQAGTSSNEYQFTIAGMADEVSTGLVKGEFDIAAIPCNLASVLYNKTKGQITLAGINTLGVLYIVETGENINSVEDLKGKTIYSTGKGTTPQYTLNYLLRAYGIDPDKDVTIEYMSEATEVAALLSKSADAVAMLPQPYVTTVLMNNEKTRIALDVAKEWDAVSLDGSSVVTGVVVVNTDFLKEHKDAVDAFLQEYAASTAYVNENVDAAADLTEKFDIFKAAVMKKAIPYCNITMIQGEDMKAKVSGYLNALYLQNPESVGGTMPGDEFYYMP